MRPRIVLFSLAAIIIVILIVLGLADELLVDLLWFGVLGYRSVFLTQLGARVTIFAGVWFVVLGLVQIIQSFQIRKDAKTIREAIDSVSERFTAR